MKRGSMHSKINAIKFQFGSMVASETVLISLKLLPWALILFGLADLFSGHLLVKARKESKIL